jgi:hypothetical protein
MYRITIPPRLPWDQNRFTPKVVAAHTDFSEIVVNPKRALADVSFHEKRMLAKGRDIDRHSRVESVKAANELVSQALYTDGMPSAHAHAVYEEVISNLPPSRLQRETTIYLPTIVREKRENDPEIPGQISKNALATIYTLQLAQALQDIASQKGDKLRFVSTPEKRMLRLDSDVRLPRREADTFQRFSRQNIYSARHFEPGDHVLISDDHVENGASIKSQIDTLERHGVTIVGIAAFGSLPESLSLQPLVDQPFIAQTLWHNRKITKDPRSIAELKIELEEALNLSGTSLHSLTSREMLSLAGVLLDNSHPTAGSFFDNLKRLFHVSDQVQEGDRNSLDVLDEPAISVSEFYREMRVNQIMETIMSRQPHISTRVEAGMVNEDDVTPFVLISAGGPAVGKSRVVDILEEKKFFPAKTLFVSASMFEDCFNEKDFAKHFHPELLQEHFDHYKEAIQRLSDWAVQNGYCFVWEDHFQDTEWTRSIVNGARAQGYESYAVGLFLDEQTHRKHREDHGQIDESTPESMEMMARFAQNWDQLMSSGIFDHARLFHRVKPANAPDWKVGTEERIICAAEYFKEGPDDEVTCLIHPVKSIPVKIGGEIVEREIDAYEIFQRWQTIQVNHDYFPGDWEGIIEGEDEALGYFSGRVVDQRQPENVRAGYATRLAASIQPKI